MAKARFKINIRFSNLSLRDKIRLVIVLTALNAGIYQVDKEMIVESFKPKIVSIQVAQANTYASVDGNGEETLVGDDVVAIQETINDSSKGEAIAPLGEDGIVEMIRRTFPEEKEVSLALFKVESGLNPNQPSTTDLMPDGRPFSTGLVQINLTQHRIGSVECHKAFRGKNYKAVVVDEVLYEKCLKLANNPVIALSKAREIYEGRGNTFNAWGAYTNMAYLNKL